MLEIETRIDIAAPSETVWAVLTDFPSYTEWNPFIQNASGVPAEGARLKVRIVPPGGKGMTFKPRLIRVREGRELRWLGHLGVPGVFDGEHAFEIVPREVNVCEFVHSERFSGILASLLMRTMAEPTRSGFHLMNEALRQRCEALVNGGAVQASTSPTSMP